MPTDILPENPGRQRLWDPQSPISTRHADAEIRHQSTPELAVKLSRFLPTVRHHDSSELAVAVGV
ncbi:hypothetical protein BTO20_19730 [Mycobacterium dioxanotrophicus]|uniref:Uncharacterized protein n=1 Tax=Mycobacterium dioxanotrophicus TaxID=482462 RepID=A0A1Y0C5M1_9MYCO|nr:hypothetical protein BTO20_19730 [Mycobacterium dioxanotrophicus]